MCGLKLSIIFGIQTLGSNSESIEINQSENPYYFRHSFSIRALETCILHPR